jgi:hypothetical protein
MTSEMPTPELSALVQKAAAAARLPPAPKVPHEWKPAHHVLQEAAAAAPRRAPEPVGDARADLRVPGDAALATVKDLPEPVGEARADRRTPEPMPEPVGSAAAHEVSERTEPSAKPKPKAEDFFVSPGDVLSGAGTLLLHAALVAAVDKKKSPSFKVAALSSGYTAEMAPLNYQATTGIQASTLDAYTARLKLLQVLFERSTNFSCGPMKFQDWLKITAQGDYDTLMYGIYAATYPGDNEFDVGCRYCGHTNKLLTDVNTLARIVDKDVYGVVMALLDPKGDFKGAVTNSLVGKETQKRLPESGIVVGVKNPSIQDHLYGIQQFQALVDKTTGLPPLSQAGADAVRTLVLYSGTILVPTPENASKYYPVTSTEGKVDLINKLSPVDGSALAAAVDSEVKRLGVNYRIPDFNCGACSKRNTELSIDFESLLFTKLRESA